jgi:SAM-dependent methyltransferase
MDAYFRRERKLGKPRTLLPGLLEQPTGIWVDAASGDGVFAEVLLELSGPALAVIAIDIKRSAVRSVLDKISTSRAAVHAVQADLRSPLPIDKADGIILANVLHFYDESEQIGILNHCNRALTAAGYLVIVEYNTDRPTRVVPHPIPREAIDSLLVRSAFEPAKKHIFARSTYLEEMYAIIASAASN